MIDELIKERKKKLADYSRAAQAYPAVVRRDKKIAEVLEAFSELLENKSALSVVGRVFAWRDQGKIIFADLRDESGKLQVVLRGEDLPEGNFSLLKNDVDVGDFIEVRGGALETQRGEKSILARSARIIAKSLRPMPSSWFGLEDVETRLRKRYLDFLLNPKTLELFRKKSRFWDTVRAYLKNRGFLEVEMPVLESIPGGAEAEPFITHHNALNRDFYLRISLELPLKKMLVGGVEKVFEIGRVFRNEGIDQEHLQDYTHMECYAAYIDYEKMMEFVEGMYGEIIRETFGALRISSSGAVLDWGRPWKRVDYYDIFLKETGVDLKAAGLSELQAKAGELKLALRGNEGKGRLVDLIYKKTVRPKLIEPCFLMDPPAAVEPLAKRLERDPDRVARFQVVAAGTELGKGFSELNDPEDQRRRLEEQMRLRAEGDAEAQRLDESFLEALEYGMPPAAGFGMSERLFAVLADKPIRETVVFPLMREETH